MVAAASLCSIYDGILFGISLSSIFLLRCLKAVRHPLLNYHNDFYFIGKGATDKDHFHKLVILFLVVYTS